MKEEIKKIFQVYMLTDLSLNDATQRVLDLFSVSSRYSLSYLDGQEFEQKTEVWAKDQDDALKQLEKICPNATYIFISRL
jgi:hypothetical protein